MATLKQRQVYQVTERSKTPGEMFYGAKAYIKYVECHEKCHDAVDRFFHDAIKNRMPTTAASTLRQ